MSILSQYKFNFTCLSYDVLDIEIFPTLFVTYCIHLFILHTLLILWKRLTGCHVKMTLDNVRRWLLQEKRKSVRKCLVCECCATGKSNQQASQGSTSCGGVHHMGGVHHAGEYITRLTVMYSPEMPVGWIFRSTTLTHQAFSHALPLLL